MYFFQISILGAIMALLIFEKFAHGQATTTKVTTNELKATIRPRAQKSCAANHGWHRKSGKCYKIGSQGPCGKLMTLTLVREASREVECLCQISHNAKEGCPSRPLVFWQPKNRCYPIFYEGPCSEGEWLEVDNETNAVCKTNPCSPSSQFTFQTRKRIQNERHAAKLEEAMLQHPFRPFLFAHKNRCYVTNTQAFCGEEETTFFPKGSLHPGCFSKKETAGNCSSTRQHSMSTGHDLPCPSGYYRDGMGGCVPPVDF